MMMIFKESTEKEKLSGLLAVSTISKTLKSIKKAFKIVWPFWNRHSRLSLDTMAVKEKYWLFPNDNWQLLTSFLFCNIPASSYGYCSSVTECTWQIHLPTTFVSLSNVRLELVMGELAFSLHSVPLILERFLALFFDSQKCLPPHCYWWFFQLSSTTAQWKISLFFEKFQRNF